MASCDRLVAVAGEASGDLIASQALARLRHQRPTLTAAGIGGPLLSQAGLERWFDSDALAVRGYIEALSKILSILAIRRSLIRRAKDWPACVYLGVDAPDFNLGVEARLRSPDCRTVHLVSPSIWAWRPERLQAIEKAVDHMLCIFPFELDCYRSSAVRATYVGHPIADQIPMQIDQQAAKAALGLGPAPVVAVMPGSRAGEIRYNGPAFFGAARRLAAHAQIIIPASSPVTARQIQQHPDFRLAREQGVQLIGATQGSLTAGPVSHAVMAAADVVLVASGTATLEAALFKKPMVIGYRVPPLTYRLMKRRALIQDIGLPNILLQRRLVPEIIQDEMTEARLASEVLALLDQGDATAEMVDAFTGLHEQLRCGAAERISALLSEELDGVHHRR